MGLKLAQWLQCLFGILLHIPNFVSTQCKRLFETRIKYLLVQNEECVQKLHQSRFDREFQAFT